eukprot:6214558-Pleurochrysis_carterae.AAC.4
MGCNMRNIPSLVSVNFSELRGNPDFSPSSSDFYRDSAVTRHALSQSESSYNCLASTPRVLKAACNAGSSIWVSIQDATAIECMA